MLQHMQQIDSHTNAVIADSKRQSWQDNLPWEATKPGARLLLEVQGCTGTPCQMVAPVTVCKMTAAIPLRTITAGQSSAHLAVRLCRLLEVEVCCAGCHQASAQGTHIDGQRRMQTPVVRRCSSSIQIPAVSAAVLGSVTDSPRAAAVQTAPKPGLKSMHSFEYARLLAVQLTRRRGR